MHLYIIRHGETNWNKEKRMQGKCDVPLNEEGIRLAKETANGMKDIHIDLCISSPLKRAATTAELVLEGRNVPIHFDERLEEIGFGDWEGECIVNSTLIPPDFRTMFHEDPLHCIVPPNGESFSDCLQRTKNLFDELCENVSYQDKSILISSHGAASRCFLANFLKKDTNLWRGCIPKNCAVTVAEIKNKKGYITELDHLFYDSSSQ